MAVKTLLLKSTTGENALVSIIVIDPERNNRLRSIDVTATPQGTRTTFAIDPAHTYQVQGKVTHEEVDSKAPEPHPASVPEQNPPQSGVQTPTTSASPPATPPATPATSATSATAPNPVPQGRASAPAHPQPQKPPVSTKDTK